MFFDVGLKNTVNYSVFGHLTLKNHGICSGFCFSPRKNTVNNSNFAVFSCFSLFFELRWSAIHGYQILRVFFPTISTFGCFWSQWPTSLAVTSGREGVRTTSFKPWRPHRGSCRGATAIEENNGSRREQWLTSLTVWTVHSICTYMIFIYIYMHRYISAVWAQRCGAGGCRREATWIWASGGQCLRLWGRASSYYTKTGEITWYHKFKSVLQKPVTFWWFQHIANWQS